MLGETLLSKYYRLLSMMKVSKFIAVAYVCMGCIFKKGKGDDTLDKDNSRHYKKHDENEKQEQLDKYRAKNTGPGEKMTDDAGFKISNDRWSLRAGKRGPTLFQDFHFYRKQSHF